MPLPREIDDLFKDCTQQAYAVYQYCSSAIAHRLLKLGWENHVNYLPPRRLVLLAMYLPQHCRRTLIMEAYAKARMLGDMPVINLVESQLKLGPYAEKTEAT